MIEQPAALMSVQDLGRTDYARFGLPESGPMDWCAHRAANQLVGNPPNTACLEIGFSHAVFRVDEDTIFAACGAGYQVTVNRRSISLWTAFQVRKGDQIVFEKITGGNWVYLAVFGGLDTPLRLGSRSTNPKVGLGNPFSAGDVLRFGFLKKSPLSLAGSYLPERFQPNYQENPEVRVIQGPHTDRFTPESFESFWHSDYLLTSRSDRMGFRLSGAGLKHLRGADLVSQGMVLGEIQVPGDGQPIVMMPDHPTTGGYPCIAAVIRCDLPLLAQAPLGTARIRFRPVEVDYARELLRETVRQVDTGIESPEETWWQW